MNKIKLNKYQNNLSCFAILVLMLFCLGTSGCAKTLYSVNMNYNAEGANIPEYLKSNKEQKNEITVAGFVDARKVDDSVIIGYVVEKDGTKNLVFPKYTKPIQAVTSGIKKYLTKAGYKTSITAGHWNLQEKTMPKSDSKLIVGGSIDEMEIVCRKGFPTDSYKATVKLTIVLADPAKENILLKSSVESRTSLEHVSFSVARMEEQINTALGDAIEKNFEDKKVAQKLKEVMAEQRDLIPRTE
ncbi:MAG: hypothetical protein ABFD50_16955 [Smithella sp.]